MSKVLPAPGTLLLAPHPSGSPTSAVVLQAARLGSVCVAEIPLVASAAAAAGSAGAGAEKSGKSAAAAAAAAGGASVLLRTRMQGWAAVLGMGYHRVGVKIEIGGSGVGWSEVAGRECWGWGQG